MKRVWRTCSPPGRPRAAWNSEQGTSWCRHGLAAELTTAWPSSVCRECLSTLTSVTMLDHGEHLGILLASLACQHSWTHTPISTTVLQADLQSLTGFSTEAGGASA